LKRLLWQLAIFVLMYSGSVQAQTEAVLRAGDVVDLSLPGEASLTGRFQIDREGGLSLPEVGVVVVAGLSVSEAESLVRQRLAATFRDVDRLKLRLQERRLPAYIDERGRRKSRESLLEFKGSDGRIQSHFVPPAA